MSLWWAFEAALILIHGGCGLLSLGLAVSGGTYQGIWWLFSVVHVASAIVMTYLVETRQ